MRTRSARYRRSTDDEPDTDGPLVGPVAAAVTEGSAAVITVVNLVLLLTPMRRRIVETAGGMAAKDGEGSLQFVGSG